MHAVIYIEACISPPETDPTSQTLIHTHRIVKLALPSLSQFLPPPHPLPPKNKLCHGRLWSVEYPEIIILHEQFQYSLSGGLAGEGAARWTGLETHSSDGNRVQTREYKQHQTIEPMHTPRKQPNPKEAFPN